MKRIWLVALLCLAYGGTPVFGSAIQECNDEHPIAECIGDCNGDDVVAIDELLKAVRHGLGEYVEPKCEAIDHDGNCVATIDELIAAVGYALNGCNLATRTPTPIRDISVSVESRQICAGRVLDNGTCVDETANTAYPLNSKPGHKVVFRFRGGPYNARIIHRVIFEQNNHLDYVTPDNKQVHNIGLPDQLYPSWLEKVEIHTYPGTFRVEYWVQLPGDVERLLVTERFTALPEDAPTAIPGTGTPTPTRTVVPGTGTPTRPVTPSTRATLFLPNDMTLRVSSSPTDVILKIKDALGVGRFNVVIRYDPDVVSIGATENLLSQCDLPAEVDDGEVSFEGDCESTLTSGEHNVFRLAVFPENAGVTDLEITTCELGGISCTSQSMRITVTN